MADNPAPRAKATRTKASRTNAPGTTTSGATGSGRTSDAESAGARGATAGSRTSAADRARGAGGISRRRLLATTGGAGAAGLALGAGGSALFVGGGDAADGPTELASVGVSAVDFHGTRQPGITTPLQAHGHLVALDLAPDAGRREAAGLLRRWSEMAAELMAGEPTEQDTGIALDAGPASLTVTFGFGHSFFDATGLAHLRPDELAPLPDFSADALDPERSGGDLWLQIGADDALVAFHALRALQRAARETARVRWQMTGFNRNPGATERPMTMRNLMGQVDGTGNPQPGDAGFDEHVFAPADSDPEWMAGGSYAVVRRIRMLLDRWDGESEAAQERIIGRRKKDGAPLSAGDDGEEGTPMDLDARDNDGAPLIAGNAHARVSAPESNGGATMLRRSFSYHDGYPTDAGADGGDGAGPDAGLLFVCWQADPRRAFVPVQRKLDRGDALSPFLRHEGSAVFAVPGGAEPGGYVGQALLEG